MILRANDLSGVKKLTGQDLKIILIKKSGTLILDTVKQEPFLAPKEYFKPQVTLIFNSDKLLFREKPAQKPQVLARKESVIMFYPLLPAYFSLYFQDRQIAHIELLFNVTTTGKASPSVIIKRKISSGNLEADLLTMRYIGRYLFIQKTLFMPDNWHTVKIDLSAR